MIGFRAAAVGVAAAVLASCSPATPIAPRPAQTALPAAPVCRVGPDDGPVLSERGIGGTGAPATQFAERGIGGTGIVGVVTGFASICLAGHEVALPAGVPIQIGGVAADPSGLRAGQVAAVEASGPAEALTARRVEIRFEVAGPIEAVAPEQLRVAGQTVLLGPDTWLRTTPMIGQWVQVSGLRDGTGAIAATRLDLVSTRTVVVRGIVERAGDGFRIGTLPIQPKPGEQLVPGQPVSVTGPYGDAGVQAALVGPDLLANDPAAYFGSGTTRFIIEGIADPIDGQIPFGARSIAPATSRPAGTNRSIATFQRTAAGIRLDSVTTPGPREQPGGGFRSSPTPSGGGGRFAPAPVPNRSFGGDHGGRPDPAARIAGPGRAGSPRQANGPVPDAGPPEPGGAGGSGAGMGGGRRR